jgi:hypothetical protein
MVTPQARRKCWWSFAGCGGLKDGVKITTPFGLAESSKLNGGGGNPTKPSSAGRPYYLRTSIVNIELQNAVGCLLPYGEKGKIQAQMGTQNAPCHCVLF